MAGKAGDRRERQRSEIRGELIAAAHQLVREEGYEGLTIRKLAARVGYAPMSVYSYFPDKHAILLALARHAFEALAKRMQSEAVSDPLQSLHGLMRQYAAFGLENPNEYRTVFMSTSPADAADDQAQRIYRENPALKLLLERVSACVEAGIFRGDVLAIATLLWTVGHGAVALLISFPDYPFGDRDRYVDQVIAVTTAGLRSAPVSAFAAAG